MLTQYSNDNHIGDYIMRQMKNMKKRSKKKDMKKKNKKKNKGMK